MKENLIILNVEKVWLRRYYIWFGGWFFKKKNIFNFVMHDISSKPFISLSTPVRKIFCEMQWSCFFHIVLWWNQSWWWKWWPTGPSEGLYGTEWLIYFIGHFCKDFEVTSKHTYRRHTFLVWFKVLSMSSSFCAEVLMILLDKLLIGKPWCNIADKIF